MWLFTTHGFFSIVEHKDDPNCLLVRARVKGDIERYWPHADVQRTDDADYLYRAKLPREDVESAILRIVQDIKYTSYKGALEDRSRYPYHVKVSASMADMQYDKDMEDSLSEGTNG